MKLNSKEILELIRGELENYKTLKDLRYRIFIRNDHEALNLDDYETPINQYGILRAVKVITKYQDDNFGINYHVLMSAFRNNESLYKEIAYIIAEEAIHEIANNTSLSGDWEKEYDVEELKKFIDILLEDEWEGDFD